MRIMKKVETTVCYLCGKSLSPPVNVDHPVMKQLFAPEIRRNHNVSQLITFDVHKNCNTAYRSDEDYFVLSLVPFAPGSVAGNAIYAKALADFRAGEQSSAHDDGAERVRPQSERPRASGWQSREAI
jgi:hypothetical protein